MKHTRILERGFDKMGTRKIPIEELTKENFSNYGEIIDPFDEEPIIKEDVFTFWNDLGTMNIKDKLDFAYLNVIQRDNIYKTLERHEETSEAFIAIDNDCILVVTLNKNNKPDLETVKAFRLEAGKGFIVYPNTWHWLPYPLKDDANLLLLSQKNTLDNDLEKVDLEKELNTTLKIDLSF